MISKNQKVKLSKFLSLILRHQPELIDVNLDDHGWLDISVLISNSKIKGVNLDLETIKEIVVTNSKKRFSLNEDCTKIRANQGHSINVDVQLKKHIPPEFLYHGTAQKFKALIIEKGIQKMSRQHVHLSIDVQTAKNIGQRHGKPVVLKILAKKMYQEGFEFFISENKVWLTEHVPTRFITNEI